MYQRPAYKFILFDDLSIIKVVDLEYDSYREEMYEVNSHHIVQNRIPA